MQTNTQAECIKYNRQQSSIIALCKEAGWKCQNDFHAISWCPHKRRSEIAAKKEYEWHTRPCEHGIPGSKDYLLIELAPEEKKRTTLFPITHNAQLL